ncbi:hypothetical protein VTL71DRAFT_9378 [Oculimacula yallundae]|uniref:Uncharacterized protein n=1 Tax=Oculimacula yallundae TaxID=86028 RepID=A0ABR4BTP2_9HELO
MQHFEFIFGWLNKHLWGDTAGTILPSNDHFEISGGEIESDTLAGGGFIAAVAQRIVLARSDINALFLAKYHKTGSGRPLEIQKPKPIFGAHLNGAQKFDTERSNYDLGPELLSLQLEADKLWCPSASVRRSSFYELVVGAFNTPGVPGIPRCILDLRQRPLPALYCLDICTAYPWHEPFVHDIASATTYTVSKLCSPRTMDPVGRSIVMVLTKF